MLITRADNSTSVATFLHCSNNLFLFSFLYSLVRFFPLDTEDEESVGDLLLQIDSILQYGEDADVQVRDFDEPEENDEQDPEM